jgi:H+/Cl- antiporter ClcA
MKDGDEVWITVRRRMLEIGMKSTAFEVHKHWLLPTMLILVVTGLVCGIVGSFVQKPFPWIVLIPGSLPLSLYFFVGRPLIRKETRGP